MLSRLPFKYKEEFDQFIQISNDRKTFIDPEFIYTDSNQQIQFTRLSSLGLNQTISKCSEFKRSQFYQNNSIINAFNILQQDLKLINQIYLNYNSIFGVWLNIQGEWNLIKVDEKIPCYLKGNITKLATLECECMWPIIIEKAIVKVLGKKYEILNRLIQESIESLLFMLTGMPTFKVSTEDINILKNVVNEQLQQNNILYAIINQNGLEYGYVIQSIKKDDFKNQELLHIRASNSSLIIKGQQQISQNDKCSFYMTWEQFSQFFGELCILKCHQNYKWISKEPQCAIQRDFSQFLENNYLVDFSLTESTHLYITFCQRDQNFYSSQLINPIKYGLLRILICKKENDEFEFITGDFNFNEYLTLELEQLTPGEYTIVCQAYFFNQFKDNPELQNLQQKIKISIFGAHVPKEITDNQQDFEITSKLMLASFAIAESNKENTRTYEKLQQPEIQVTTQMNLGMLYFYYRNMGTTNIEEEVQFDVCKNIVEYKTMKKNNKFNVTVISHNDYLVQYVYDPLCIFNEEEPIFEYSCSIKSLVHSTRKTLLTQSMHQSRAFTKQSLFENNQISPSLELIAFMKQKAERAQRTWNDGPIDVEMYLYQHDSGVIILYLNSSSGVYEEKIQFQKLDNLIINCLPSLKQGNQVYFSLDPLAHLFIYLDILDNQKAYSYQIQCNYQHYN